MEPDPIHTSSARAEPTLNMKITALRMLLSFDYCRTMVFSHCNFLSVSETCSQVLTRVQLHELSRAGHPCVTGTWVLSFVTVGLIVGQRKNIVGQFSGQIHPFDSCFPL